MTDPYDLTTPINDLPPSDRTEMFAARLLMKDRQLTEMLTEVDELKRRAFSKDFGEDALARLDATPTPEIQPEGKLTWP